MLLQELAEQLAFARIAQQRVDRARQIQPAVADAGVAHRLVVEGAKGLEVGRGGRAQEAFQIGGLAGGDILVEGPQHDVFGAEQVAQRLVERDPGKTVRPQPGHVAVEIVPGAFVHGLQVVAFQERGLVADVVDHPPGPVGAQGLAQVGTMARGIGVKMRRLLAERAPQRVFMRQHETAHLAGLGLGDAGAQAFGAGRDLGRAAPADELVAFAARHRPDAGGLALAFLVAQVFLDKRGPGLVGTEMQDKRAQGHGTPFVVMTALSGAFGAACQSGWPQGARPATPRPSRAAPALPRPGPDRPCPTLQPLPPLPRRRCPAPCRG